MMEDKTIVVSVRSVYGVDKIYPACETAKLFADIAGTTTLREPDLRRIQKLGYQIVVSQPPPKWVHINNEE